MMLRMISVSLFLFGATVGWLIVYFVRKYKEHNPKGLRETIVLFLGGGCMELLLSLIDKQVVEGTKRSVYLRESPKMMEEPRIEIVR